MSSALDDVAYELKTLRTDGVQIQVDTDISFSQDTETAILALASHFAGNHDMCDHKKPEEKEKIIYMTQPQDHIVITVDVQKVTFEEQPADGTGRSASYAGTPKIYERRVAEQGRFSVQAPDLNQAREKASKMLDAI